MSTALDAQAIWIEMVDQLGINLKWKRDPADSDILTARFGDDIDVRVWPRRLGDSTEYLNCVQWHGHHREFRSRGEHSLSAAKESAALAVKMFVADMIQDASSKS